jgi:hypothetical protein
MEPLTFFCSSFPEVQVDLCICAASHHELSFVEVVDFLVGNEDLSKLVEQGSVVIKPLVPAEYKTSAYQTSVYCQARPEICRTT